MGLDGLFGDVEIGQDRIFMIVVQISLDKLSPDYYNTTHERFNGCRLSHKVYQGRTQGSDLYLFIRGHSASGQT